MKRTLLLFATCLALVACATRTGPVDVVLTSADAIKIATDVCSSLEPTHFRDLWKAERHGDTWSAWFSAGKYDGECGIYDVSIRAEDGAVSDGKTFMHSHDVRGCQLCVH